MFKGLKWLIRLFLVLAIIFVVGYVYYVYIDHGVAMTSYQEEIVDSLGSPEQFSISYLPKGSDEGSEFVRQETWYYPSRKQKVNFLNGRLVDVAELEVADDASYNHSQYSPSDFDVYTTLSQIKNLVGEKNIAALELPGFYGEGIETWASSGAVFIFENDYLTYVETLD